jgi:hypothetical protein
VFVGDGSAATSATFRSIRDPQSLDQVLDFLARLRPANSLNLLAYRRAPALSWQAKRCHRCRPVSRRSWDRGRATARRARPLRLQADRSINPFPSRGRSA